MIPKADRDADKAILAAATGGTWITASPRSQEGSANLATFGPAVTPLPTMAAVVLRVAESGAAPLSEEQHAANAKAAAHAVNRLPAYIEAAAEMERRIVAVDEVRGHFKASADELDEQGVYTKAMDPREKEWLLDRVMVLLRGGK